MGCRMKTTEIEFDGVKREVLFTLNVIDAIQDRFDMTIYDILDSMTDERQQVKMVKFILKELLDDEVDRKEYERQEHNLIRYTEKEVGFLLSQSECAELTGKILSAYVSSLPEIDEDDPNRESGEQSS